MMDHDDVLLNAHMWAWACAVAFAVYYSHGHLNPEFPDQMHTLSGIMVYGPELFGTLLSGFAGAVLLASASRVRGDVWALLMLLLMYVGLLVLVHYDVRSHRTVHYVALGVLLVAGALYLWRVVEGWTLWYLFAAATGTFVMVILVNVCLTRWAPPFMTVQAVVEILWVLSLMGAVMGYAVS